jgi:hypothetical protein
MSSGAVDVVHFPPELQFLEEFYQFSSPIQAIFTYFPSICEAKSIATAPVISHFPPTHAKHIMPFKNL